MKLPSTSKLLSALALALGIIGVTDWVELATNGPIHNAIETIRHAVMFILSVAFALYATDRAGSGKGNQTSSDSTEDQSSDHRFRGKKITITGLLAYVPRTLYALLNRRWVLLYKGLFTFGLSLVSLMLTADAYSHGNFVTWSNCFLVCAAALGFWLSLVLHLVTDNHLSEGTGSSPRPISRKPIVDSLADNPRGESLALLLISQFILCFAIACLVTALKQGEHVWLSFVGESAACICFTTLFVRTQLTFLRTQDSE